MPRPEKVQAVADIKERIENAQAVFLAEYAGLSVAQQQTLRRELKANGAEFKVVKMTLARLAAAELDIDTLDEHLLGPTGIAIADGDAVAAAKVLKDFAGSNEVFKVKGGLLGLDYLSPERISELADIEPREVLLAKVAGLFAAPMGQVAGLFEALQRDTVGLVQALVDKREESGEVAEPAAAEEAEVEEAAAPEAAADEAPVEEAEVEETAAPEAAADEAPEEEAEADSADADAEPTTDDAEEAAEGDDTPEATAEPASEESADDSEADEADEAEESGEADDTASSDEGEEDDAPASSDEEDDDGDSEEAEEE